VKGDAEAGVDAWRDLLEFLDAKTVAQPRTEGRLTL
jgi:hypothetical protein